MIILTIVFSYSIECQRMLMDRMFEIIDQGIDLVPRFLPSPTFTERVLASFLLLSVLSAFSSPTHS